MPHLTEGPVCHHIHVISLEVKQQVAPDSRALGDQDVRVLNARAGAFHHGLTEPAVSGAQEGHGEVTGAGGEECKQEMTGFVNGMWYVIGMYYQTPIIFQYMGQMVYE